MNWTRPTDLRTQVLKLWERGDILACIVTGESLFPKRLSIKGPTSAEIAKHFDATRIWISELRALSHFRIEMKEFKHRTLGTNAVPHSAWLDSLEEAVALIGKQRDTKRFNELLEITRQQQVPLLAWLAKKPLRALALFDEWPKLLEIVAWVQAHPRPNIYLRQVDIPGIHTKFIETHIGVLAELLDQTLSSEAFDATVSGVSRFAQRYGFRDKPVHIRFRVLDPEYALLPGSTMQDIALDASSFAALNPSLSQVFVTENEVNFLAFPPVKDSLIIFGKGYGFETLRKTEWLRKRRIYYWGDIDTHGFAILDGFRAHFPHAESFLMDRATLLEFQCQWGTEDKQDARDLSRLTRDEQSLYNDLRDNRLQKNLRLEQERIGFNWIDRILSELDWLPA